MRDLCFLELCATQNSGIHCMTRPQTMRLYLFVTLQIATLFKSWSMGFLKSKVLYIFANNQSHIHLQNICSSCECIRKTLTCNTAPITENSESIRFILFTNLLPKTPSQAAFVSRMSYIRSNRTNIQSSYIIALCQNAEKQPNAENGHAAFIRPFS